MAITHEIRIYDTSGARQPLPERFILGWQFELVDRGGCGTFELTLAAEMDDEHLPAIPGGNWRVEFFLDGSRVYRGWTLQISGGIQEGGGPYKLMGIGLMARCSTFLVDCAFAHPGGEDLGEIFAWLFGKFLKGEGRLGTVTDSIQRDTDYKIERAEFFGSNVREAFDRMADSAAGLLIWGWNTSPGGVDRLYVKLRPTTTPDEHIFRVGGNVAYHQQPVDLGELINVIRLVGGTSKAPNLLFNPSWELPAVPGEDASGSLLLNPSFEGDDHWTFIPSPASIRQASGGEPGEYARTGNHLVELDDSGDAITQTATLPLGGQGAGKLYRLVIHHAAEFAKEDPEDDDPTIKVKVEEFDTTGPALATLIDDSVTDATASNYGRIASTSRSYEKWEKELLTTHTATKRLKITITRHLKETIVDDVYLFRDSAVQEGWTTNRPGGWQGTVQWVCDEVPPYHGCYCIKATVTSGEVPPTNKRHFQISPNQDRWLQARELTSYVLKIRVRGVAGTQIRLGMYRLLGAGGSRLAIGSVFTLADTDDWQTHTTILSTGADMSQIRPFVALWTMGATYYLDAFEVYESGLEDRDDADFLDGEALIYTYRAGDLKSHLTVHATNNQKVKSTNDAAPLTAKEVGKVLRVTGGTGWTPGDYPITAFDGEYVTLHASPAATSATGGSGGVIISSDISDAAMASIATYGLRETVVEVPELTELEQARNFAAGYLNRYAVPLLRGQLALEPVEQVLRHVQADEHATPTGMIGIRGAGVELPDQYPARIVYSLTKEGAVRCELDLTNRRPDRNLLLKKALGGKNSGGGGGYSGGGANLRPGPGNSGNTGENGTAPIWRIDDTDIGARSSLNLKAGTGVTLSGTDDEENDEVAVEISAAVSLVVQEGDTTTVATANALDFAAADFVVDEGPSGEANIALAPQLNSNARVGVTVNSSGTTVQARTINVLSGAGISLDVDGGVGDVADLTISANSPSNGSVEELVGTWAHGDISAMTNTTWSELNCGENPGTTIRASLSAGRAGTLTRLVIDLHDDIGGASVEFQAKIYKNGSPTTAVATITGSAGSTDYYACWSGSLAVNATDRISVWGYRDGGVAGRRLVARVYMV